MMLVTVMSYLNNKIYCYWLPLRQQKRPVAYYIVSSVKT